MSDPQNQRLRQFLWFIALWSAGVATLTVVAWIIRLAMHAAGMTSVH